MIITNIREGGTQVHIYRRGVTSAALVHMLSTTDMGRPIVKNQLVYHVAGDDWRIGSISALMYAPENVAALLNTPMDKILAEGYDPALKDEPAECHTPASYIRSSPSIHLWGGDRDILLTTNIGCIHAAHSCIVQDDEPGELLSYPRNSSIDFIRSQLPAWVFPYWQALAIPLTVEEQRLLEALDELMI